jgi:hypothetical protein
MVYGWALGLHHRWTMTCRIDRLATEDDGAILRVSGRCVGRALDVLRDALAEGHRVRTIDLKDVRQVDRAAVTLLATSEAGGIELKNCPAFIQEWIAREREVRDSRSSSDGRDR